MPKAAGKRFAAVELNFLISRVIITEDHQLVAERRAREQGPGVTAEQLLGNPYLLLGSINQLVARIQRWREVYGISYLVVGPKDMEAFAPVVARHAGT